MTYNIEITYTTSSTFDPTTTESGFLRSDYSSGPVLWDSRDEAREAMRRVAEFCKIMNRQEREERYFRGSRKAWEEKCRSEIPKWFKFKDKRSKDIRYIQDINVPHNGNEIYVDIGFFTGYFDSLKTLEIVADKSDDFIDFDLWRE